MGNPNAKQQNMKLEDSDLSREQILDLADAAGKKLGVLLALSPISVEIKEALLDVLGAATSEQIDNLTNILEKDYLQASVYGLEKRVKREIEEVREDVKNVEGGIEDEALAQLSDLEKKFAS